MDILAANNAPSADETGAHAESPTIPADIRACLSSEQIGRLTIMLTPPQARHSYTYRASTSWFGERFYLAIFMGREQRRPDRLDQEDCERSLLALLMNIASIALVISVLLIFLIGAAFVLAYLLKSAAGIDLFEEHSFLHHFFFD